MSKNIYLIIASSCLALVGFALWIQHIGWEGVLYPPCPLCILQRLAYLGIATACLWAYFSKAWKPWFHAIAGISALFGLGVVLRHMWVIDHPTVSCGWDPLEIWINQWSLVRKLNWLLQADGLCSAPLPPVFGLSVPAWSLVCLSLLTVALLSTWFVARKQSLD